jgi:hypothetical protein
MPEIKIMETVVLTLGLVLFLGAGAPATSQGPMKPQPIKDFTNVDPVSLGVLPVRPKTDPKTGFVVGGKNRAELIRALTEIKGRAVADLESNMRPGAPSPVGSTGGFLGKQESLLEVLATDNDEVVERRGLTHQELAKYMHVLGAIGGRIKEEEFLYHGRRFTVKVVVYRGDQLSPFYDETKSSAEATVRNLDNNRQIEYSLLVPFMVERYGFYEGRGTPYRVDPGKLLEVLDFVGKVPKVVPPATPPTKPRPK